MGLFSALLHEPEPLTVLISSPEVHLLVLRPECCAKFTTKAQDALLDMIRAKSDWYAHRALHVTELPAQVAKRMAHLHSEVQQSQIPLLMDSPFLRRQGQGKPGLAKLEAICSHYGNEVHPESDWLYAPQSRGFFQSLRLSPGVAPCERGDRLCAGMPPKGLLLQRRHASSMAATQEAGARSARGPVAMPAALEQPAPLLARSSRRAKHSSIATALAPLGKVSLILSSFGVPSVTTTAGADGMAGASSRGAAGKGTAVGGRFRSRAMQQRQAEARPGGAFVSANTTGQGRPHRQQRALRSSTNNFEERCSSGPPSPTAPDAVLKSPKRLSVQRMRTRRLPSKDKEGTRRGEENGAFHFQADDSLCVGTAAAGRGGGAEVRLPQELGKGPRRGTNRQVLQGASVQRQSAFGELESGGLALQAGRSFKIAAEAGSGKGHGDPFCLNVDDEDEEEEDQPFGEETEGSLRQDEWTESSVRSSDRLSPETPPGEELAA